MEQVRMCRSERIKALNRDLVTYGDWVQSTPEVVASFQDLIDAGNERFGRGSHWLERRHLAAGSAQPDQAIRRLIEDSMGSWIEGDLEKHLSFFTEGAVLITPMGTSHRGHDGLHHAFASERASMPGLSMTVEDVQISYPTPEAGIVLMEGVLSHSQVPSPQRWACTQMVVRMPSSRWLIASLHIYHVHGADEERPERSGGSQIR